MASIRALSDVDVQRLCCILTNAIVAGSEDCVQATSAKLTGANDVCASQNARRRLLEVPELVVVCIMTGALPVAAAIARNLPPTWHAYQNTKREMRRLENTVSSQEEEEEKAEEEEQGGNRERVAVTDNTLRVCNIWIKRTVSDAVHAEKREPVVYRQDLDLAEACFGRKVLIVDDIAKFGKTMALAERVVRDYGAIEVATAALLCSDTAKPYVQYAGGKVDIQEWILFPWKEKPGKLN